MFRFLAPLLLVTGLLGVVLTIIHFQFQVEYLVCETTEGNCPEMVMPLLDKTKHSSLFFTDHHSLVAADLAKLGWRVNSIKKKLPQQLIMQLSPEQPVYRLYFSPDKAEIYFTSGAFVTESNPSLESALTTIQFYDPTGTPPPLTHSFLNVVIPTLQEQQVGFTTLQLQSDGALELTLPSGQKAVIDRDQPQAQVTKLKMILDQLDFASFSQPIQIIDLRFKYPVLKTQQDTREFSPIELSTDQAATPSVTPISTASASPAE
ncbi:MAG TPA: hypothetical protein VD999_05595 [Vitreimonas sp.]|nr:hypothetical protein [Vitreimonas sp.]